MTKMFKPTAFLIFLLYGSLSIFAQSTPNIPRAEVLPTPEFKDTREEDFKKRSDEMSADLKRAQANSELSGRLPTKEELERINAIVAPAKEDLAKYKDFLKQKNTGIFRLMPDYGCESKNLIRLDGDCAKSVPGKWAYSFRKNGYSNENFHDIWFTEGKLISEALLSQALLVSLGDVPLDDLTAASAGMRFLLDFEPSAEKAIIRSQFHLISGGFENYGFLYSNKVNVKENNTYALRVVAYQMDDKFYDRFSKKNFKDLTSADGKFIWIRYDKRIDLIIAFRIVKTGDDGGITIVWKQLSKQKPPKIVFEKHEKLADFRN